MKKILGSAIALIIFFPSAVLAVSQPTDPIVIKNALRGQNIQKHLTVVNTENRAIKILLRTSGDVKDWVSFVKAKELKDKIEVMDLAPKEKKDIGIIFSIPNDEPNGIYGGAVVIAQLSESSAVASSTFNSVVQEIQRDISIMINDKEIIEFDATIVPLKQNYYSNENMLLNLIYENKGNISIKPEARLDIKQDGRLIYSFNYPYSQDKPRIKPLSQVEISNINVPIEILDAGKYTAEMFFSQAGKNMFKKDFDFDIANRGLVLGVRDLNLQYTWPIFAGAILVLTAFSYVMFSRFWHAIVNKSNNEEDEHIL